MKCTTNICIPWRQHICTLIWPPWRHLITIYRFSFSYPQREAWPRLKNVCVGRYEWLSRQKSWLKTKAAHETSLAPKVDSRIFNSFFKDMRLRYLSILFLLQIQTISQPELNVFNSSELLQHTEQIRKAKLLRTLAKQYLWSRSIEHVV